MTLYRAIVALLNAITRLLNAHAVRMEAPPPKQEVDVLPRRTPEEEQILEEMRHFPELRGRYPREYREIIEAEERELGNLS